MQRDPEREEGRLIRSCLPGNSGVILEIGCGDGRLSGELAQLSDLLVGIDIFVEQLQLAQSAITSTFQAVSARGELLPIKANCIDIVVFTLSLHHHQNPGKALDEAVRVLTEDGKILVLEPDANVLLSKLFAILHDESNEYHSAEAAINQSGLIIMRSGSIQTQWIFDGFEELVNYLFTFHGINREESMVDQMANLVKDSRGNSPLSIRDTTRFWLLRSGA